MRCFDVSVDKEKREIICNPEVMHVPPHFYENIAVCLDDASVGKYDLNLSLDDDPGNALAKQKLSPSVTVLEDDNREPSVAKFSISLTAIKGAGGIDDLDDLDPRVVNE